MLLIPLPGDIHRQDRSVHGRVVLELVNAASIFIVDVVGPVPAEDGYVLPGLKFHESHKVPGEIGPCPKASDISPQVESPFVRNSPFVARANDGSTQFCLNVFLGEPPIPIRGFR